eukprot:gnl/TRDRNA2_/TRDRNA2_84188_c0_seq1.p1 gnl/TRDRNA2_/TRDRNA2_84188_c0~~gnl/TRDRNA2_/TRDRNA2_84188_c0_seq1.p1  ORF type:complete len:805 (-),score=196.69 gnl/TRDRNA2_/TRDRNA2_84188_c0_seq1:184-2493(-)
MPKPVPATQDEVRALQQNLEGQINSLKAEAATKGDLQAAQQGASAEVQKLRDEVIKNAAAAEQASQRVAKDSKDHAEANGKKVQDTCLGANGKTEAALKKAQADIDATIKSTDKAVRKMVADELAILCGKFDEELQALNQDLVSKMEAQAVKDEQALNKQRFELDSAIEAARKEALDRDTENRATTTAEMDRRFAEQAAKDKNQDDKSQRAQGEIYLRIEAIEKALKEEEERTKKMVDELHGSAHGALGEFSSETDRHLAELDEETAKLRSAMSEVENCSTRRVEWVIQNASKVLRPPDLSRCSLHTSFFSPKFDMAGAHGLQLELQLFRPSDVPVEGADAGDVALFLWASKGMHMVYKIYIGNKSTTCEKIFNGRVPYGSKRLCFLKDQINKEDNTVRIGVEVMEAIREIEAPIKVPALEEDVADEDVREDNYERPDETRATRINGSIIFNRHVNNRVLAQVRKEVDRMQSRMVRRIEWRIEQASMLRRCFPQGDPMCSSSFSACGVEGMQLIFYPGGYGGSTEGYCSLFLYCPAGTTLRCWLWLKQQKREAHHSFEEAGAFGRTNFCRFDSTVDEDTDSILVVLEVEDAHQDLRATLAHPTVAPGDTRSQGQLDGTTGGPIESVVKLTRIAGNLSKNLSEVKTLPSLWTAKPIGETTAPPDGYHTYGELAGKAAKGGGKPKKQPGMLPIEVYGESSPEPPRESRGPQGSMMRNDSVPSMNRNESLPMLSRSYGGGAGGEWNQDKGKKKGNGRFKGELGSAPFAATLP